MMATVASVGLAAAMGQPISPFPSLDKTQHLHRHAGFLGGGIHTHKFGSLPWGSIHAQELGLETCKL